MDNGYQQREFTRVQVNLLTELRTGGTVKIIGKLCNISLGGLWLTCEAKLPVGTPCEATLVLDGGLGQVYIQAHGTVIRMKPSGIAVHFTELVGEESLAHLRNLVRYNSGYQATQVEQEFSDHMGLKIKS